jgi:hypothetical protein
MVLRLGVADGVAALGAHLGQQSGHGVLVDVNVSISGAGCCSQLQ